MAKTKRKKVREMIKLTQERVKDVLAYMEDDLPNCLYLYGDIVCYGVDDPNMTVWFSEKNGKINLVVMKYFAAAQIYSKKLDYDLNKLVSKLKELSPDRIQAQKEIIEALTVVLQSEYTSEYGYVFELKHYRAVKSPVKIERAKPEDADAIAELMVSTDYWSKMYERDSLAQELADRMRNGIGRSYVIWDGNRVVAHDGVSLETDKYLIESLAALHSDYRKTFYGLFIESYIVNEVKKEGKKIYTFIVEGGRADGFKKAGNVIEGYYGKMCRRSLREV